MTANKKNGAERVQLGSVNLATMQEPERLERAAIELCEALGVANDPNGPLEAQEGAAIDALLAFAQDLLPDLRQTGALNVLQRLSQRRLQQVRDLYTREPGLGRSGVVMTEEQLRVYAIASVRFLVVHGQLTKSKARQTVADVLRSHGARIAPSALANWEKAWLPAQEIDAHHGPILPDASPVKAVQVVQDALGEAYKSAIHDPVQLVRQVLRMPAANR